MKPSIEWNKLLNLLECFKEHFYYLLGVLFWIIKNEKKNKFSFKFIWLLQNEFKYVLFITSKGNLNCSTRNKIDFWINWRNLEKKKSI